MKRSALLTAALAAVLACAPAAEAKPKKRCKLKGGEVAAKNSRAIVWTREAGEGAAFDHELWGCQRKNGKRVKIESLSTTTSGGFGYGQILLRGMHVAYSANGGSGGQCVAAVRVYSLAKRKTSHRYREDSFDPPSCVSVDTLVLGARGRAAFTVENSDSRAIELHKLDATGRVRVDSGAIDSDSVLISGPNFDWRLRWFKAGEARELRVW